MYSVVLMMALSGSADVPACHRGGCGGCYGGGCAGYSCGGCAGNCGGCRGGCHGFLGGRHRRGCHGCNGCYGGGCYGGGCYGGGCYGGGCVGSAPAPAKAMPKTPAGGEKLKTPPKESKEESSLMPAPATIVVSLPAEAKLTIDGNATQSTSSTRVFASPALEQGKEYFYTLKAEMLLDGKTVSTTQRVTVRAGNEARVTLNLPVATVAQR